MLSAQGTFGSRDDRQTGVNAEQTRLKLDRCGGKGRIEVRDKRSQKINKAAENGTENGQLEEDH